MELSFKNLGQEIINTVEANVPYLETFARNFSNVEAGVSGSVTIHDLDNPSTSLYSPTTGFTTTDASGNDYTVTLDKYRGVREAIDSNQVNSNVVNWMDPIATKLADALAKDISKDLFGLLTSTNFSHSSSIAEASMSLNNLLALKAALDSREVGTAPRTLVLVDGHYNALLQDEKVQNTAQFYNSEVNTVKTGKLPVLGGFEIASINSNYIAANTKGVALHRNGLLIAARSPKLIGAPGVIEEGVVVSEKTGLPAHFIAWVDLATRKQYFEMSVIYGVAKGVNGAVQRIV